MEFEHYYKHGLKVLTVTNEDYDPISSVSMELLDETLTKVSTNLGALALKNNSKLKDHTLFSAAQMASWIYKITRSESETDQGLWFNPKLLAPWIKRMNLKVYGRAGNRTLYYLYYHENTGKVLIQREYERMVKEEQNA